MKDFKNENEVEVKEFFVRFKGDMTIEKYILIPVKSAELGNGYLHLLEHMLIQQNRQWFTYIENENVCFNAITSKDRIEFIFLYFHKTITIDFMKFFETNFSHENLELEK